MYSKYSIVKLLQVLGVILGTLSWITVGCWYLGLWPITGVGALLVGFTLLIFASVAVLTRTVAPAAMAVLVSAAICFGIFSFFWIVMAVSPISNDDAKGALYLRAVECGALAVFSCLVLVIFRKRFRVEI